MRLSFVIPVLAAVGSPAFGHHSRAPYDMTRDESIYLPLIYAKGVRDDIDAKTLDRVRRTLDGEDD